MRFLIGLIGGALLVVLVAPDPARPGPLRDWAVALGRTIDEVWRSPPAVAPAAVPHVTVAAASRAAAPEPAATPIPRPPDPLPAERLAPEPMVAASSAAATLATAVRPASEAATTSAPGEASLMPASPAEADFAMAPASRPAAPGAPAAASPDPGAAAAVWTPFHSERSAVGFADRLTREVDHPFRVERRGPGRYQVVFGYRDELERRSLMDQAAAATGLPL